MSNNKDNDKQPLDLTESLPLFDKAQAPSTTTSTVNKLEYDGISLVERRSRDVKPREKNDSLGISGINQPDVTIGILLDCAKRGENLGNQRPPSICKVSIILRDLKRSFNPQLVSIGPIHRDDPKLHEFEQLKERYLDDLLKSCDSTQKKTRCDSTQKKAIEACVLQVNTLIPQIRESYAGMIKDYRDVDLARMMVMDGCFILEFCFKHKKKNENLPNKMQNSRIAMDLMLLENQVPFVVLQALFDCLAPYNHIVNAKGSVTLSQLLDDFLVPYVNLFHSPEKISTTNVDSDSTHDHVLSYLHKRCQLVDEEGKENTAFCSHSIVELDRSGMNFKPHQKDIEYQPSLFPCLPLFWSKPTLLMPTLIIADTTELILRNLIAYEQSFPQDHYYFTSYAHAMDMLIDTQEDVAKLVESKVLVNDLVSNQEAADMINEICKNMFVTDFYYTEEFKQMDKYYNRFWPKNKRIYFSNPWNAFNLLVGIIVFLATMVATIFAVLDYFR